MNLKKQRHQRPTRFRSKQTQLNDEIHDLVLQHGLRVEISDQERNIVPLRVHQPPQQNAEGGGRDELQRTFTGFLLKTTKLSARCIINLVNL